ncbi:alpha/beta hydrolase [Persicobacter psychrovividus]|uniref:BD-FAE-like domain-containing protein n=1 Tax=Persicobacter psychrovividus TaxID=387638 RepID=A0ABM7VLP9_9BACT|nr:hypothetical protein PEPS_41980 [Persicobacter psychrovividus]
MIVFAQNKEEITIPLYDGLPPNSIAMEGKEIVNHSDGIMKISNIQTPSISVYLPPKEKATGEAVVICPGGGYWILAYDLEGTDIAEYYNTQGIAAIILKYRLPTSHPAKVRHESSLMDAQRAIRLTRQHAEEWHIHSEKIGIIGFSAGGHLAAMASVNYDQGKPDDKDQTEHYSCRPDFSLLIYPVITFTEDFTNEGTRKALLGTEEQDQKLREKFSPERYVNANTPPTFLIHSMDDDVVDYQNSELYFNACRTEEVMTELHLFPIGGHGFGLGKQYQGVDQWAKLSVDFIRRLSK